MSSTICSRYLHFLLTALLVSGAASLAQSPAEPYAAINRDAVSYTGPGRDAAHDLSGPEIKIGLLAPLAGPRQAEGEALVHAAQLAVEDESASPFPDGRRLTLAVRDESGPWSRASSEIVHLVFNDSAVALVTSLAGGAAHLAEQVGNKIGVPVLTLSTDKTTTQINLPWIFRLGPTDAAQARAFAQDIYRARGLRRVLLLTEGDHDGRVGGEEFEKATREFTAPSPIHLVVDSSPHGTNSAIEQISTAKPEAIVLWVGPETVSRLVGEAKSVDRSVPVYLCRKAAQGLFEGQELPECKSCPTYLHGMAQTGMNPPRRGSAENSPSGDDSGIWVVAPLNGAKATWTQFERRYRERFGTTPGPAAAQAYDALRVIATCLRHSGPNRARLRDALAEVTNFSGASGTVSFDHAGNDLTEGTLTRIR